MSKIPVTNFKFNTRIIPPKLGTGHQEIAIQNMKDQVLKATHLFCKTKCKANGELNINSLTSSEKRGRNKLMRRVKAGEIVLQTTDKSGKLAIWSKQLYSQAAEEHLSKDTKVNQADVDKLERCSNILAACTCTIFNLGSDLNQEDRCLKAMTVLDVHPPSTYYLGKDHKTIPQGQTFPKTRPVCGASNGPLSRIDDFWSKVVGHVADSMNAPSECINTEMLKRGFLDANQRILESSDKDLTTVIMSLDVSAMYPSLDTTVSSKLVMRGVIDSQVQFQNIDYREVGKVLRVLCSDNELKTNKIITVVPAKSMDLVSMTQKSQITYLKGESASKGVDKWVWRTNREPSDKQKTKMMGLLLEKIVKWIMENHIYMFDSELYRQTSGAPIGLKISVSISRIVMIFWDRWMMIRMIDKNLKTEVFLRYVDDCSIVVRVKKSDFNEDGELDYQVAQLVTQEADQVLPGTLRFESDFCSQNYDKMLPILVGQCWIDVAGLMKHTLYKKPIIRLNFGRIFKVMAPLK